MFSVTVAESALVLPAGSMALALSTWLPSLRSTAAVNSQLPAALDRVSPISVLPSKICTRTWASAVPARVGRAVPTEPAGVVMAGGLTWLSTLSTQSCDQSLSVPVTSCATRV